MPDKDENSRLIEKAKNNDMQAFEQLIVSHEKIVFNIVYRMTNNQEDVKDISQEVFIKAFRNIKKFDEKSAFSTWIYKIATNTCIDEMRKRKGKETVSLDEELELDEGGVKKQIADSSDLPEECMIRAERHKEIINALNQLSDEHKKAIVLRDLNGLSYTEIAEIMELSMGTVKSRIARARVQLKNILLQTVEHNGASKRQKSRREG